MEEPISMSFILGQRIYLSRVGRLNCRARLPTWRFMAFQERRNNKDPGMKRVYMKIVYFFFLGLGTVSCQPKAPRVFERLSVNQTGIRFNNLVDEDEQNNVNTYMNIYTGGGVAAGDINNDGLVDLFFSGNMVSSRLYLNNGDLHFEDITESSGVLTTRWGTGAVMADVNQDGWLDIYLCVSGSAPDRTNLLFINNQNNTFKESGMAYGLADSRQAMH